MPTVLIADDSSAIRAVIRSFAERKPGFQIYEAVDGLEAVEKARQYKPDLIILDLSMPGMNGLEAARAVRAEMKDAQIILFTMFADAVQPSQLAEAGISAVVPKAEATRLIRFIDTMLPARSRSNSA